MFILFGFWRVWERRVVHNLRLTGIFVLGRWQGAQLVNGVRGPFREVAEATGDPTVSRVQKIRWKTPSTFL